MLITTLARKEHKRPSEIAQWTLPEIVYLYSSYYDESQQMEDMNREMEENSKNN